MNGGTDLWNPLTSCFFVMIQTDAGIEGEPGSEVVPIVSVAGHFVHALVYKLSLLSFLGTIDKLVPSFSPCVIPVSTQGKVTGNTQLYALIPGDAPHLVTGMETEVQRCFTQCSIIAVIDLVPSPIEEETEGTGSLFVSVLYR